MHCHGKRARNLPTPSLHHFTDFERLQKEYYRLVKDRFVEVCVLLILQIKFDILFLRCAKIVFFVSISVTNFQQLTFNLGKTLTFFINYQTGPSLRSLFCIRGYCCPVNYLRYFKLKFFIGKIQQQNFSSVQIILLCFNGLLCSQYNTFKLLFIHISKEIFWNNITFIPQVNFSNNF